MRKLATRSLHHVRRDYSPPPFRRADLPADPLDLFERWLQEAADADIPEVNAMSLATAGQDGRVTCRTVLLKAFDESGFVFFTNYGSEKSRQIAENPKVAALFPWLPMARQVEITGKAQKISAVESLGYFVKRPFKSRVGALISAQSSVISSRSLLEAKFAEMCEKFANGNVPLPEAWGGYRIVPDSFEFWQGGGNRLHDRFIYRPTPDEAWQIDRLAP